MISGLLTTLPKNDLSVRTVMWPKVRALENNEALTEPQDGKLERVQPGHKALGIVPTE